MTDRTKRIRDAKSEAQKEIEEYRNQKENEYKKFEAEVRLSAATAMDTAAAATSMLTIYTALERIQDSRGRCEQGSRGEVEGN